MRFTETAGGSTTALIGRADEMALASAALDHGGCVIAGPAGVGKSRLAAEVAGGCGRPATRVVATAAASVLPYGAFASLLASAPIDGRGPLFSVLSLLRRRAPNGQSTLVLDDAHLLDPASAALLLAVRESGVANLLVTLRHRERVPDAVTALWKDFGLERLDLGPLTRQELRQFVEAHLGGKADASVHATTFSLTEGNPLFAGELLIDACRSGALAVRDGRWRWTGKPRKLARLSDLIRARTTVLSAEGRLAFEVLCIGAPLGLDELIAATSEGGVAELERSGLASAQRMGESVLFDLTHPLFGEVTLDELPVVTARQHRTRLARELERRRPTDDLAILRLATLKLDTGIPDPELFVRAGTFAMQIPAGVPGPGWGGCDPQLAIRLADAAGPRLDAVILGARGRIALNRFAEVEQKLAPLEADAAQAPLDQATEYLRSRVSALHWGGEGTETALDLLLRANLWRTEPEWRALHATLRAWILLDLARPGASLEAVEGVPALKGVTPGRRLDAFVVMGLALTRLGLNERCESLEPRVCELVATLRAAGAETGWAVHMVDAFARTEAAIDLESVSARLERGKEQAEEAGDVALAAALTFAVARVKLVRGLCRDAIGLLEDALDGFSSGDPRNALGFALTSLARAQAVAGDATRAKKALARAEALARERVSHLSLMLEVQRAEAWCDAACGHLSKARNRLMELADASGESVADEFAATYDALRFGAPAGPCAKRLTNLARRTENPLFDACAAHATAVADKEALGQLRAAETFAQLDLDLWAAEAAAGAAKALEAEGRPSSARRATALAMKHASRCGDPVTPALMFSTTVDQLTLREREVAGLAAAGRSNAEIAAEMFLSIRTVETYLLRACRKLGVGKRADLEAVLTLE